MSAHTWVVDPPYESWEEGAPVGTIYVNLRCSACDSIAQFTASGLRPCNRGDERLLHQWTALPPPHVNGEEDA